MSQSIATKLASGLKDQTDDLPHLRLSDRELEVYRRLVLGEPITAIATARCVSGKTVSTYKMPLMEKNAGMPNEAMLLRYAMRNHLFRRRHGPVTPHRSAGRRRLQATDARLPARP